MHNIPSVIDVKDQWPELFVDLLFCPRLPVLGGSLLSLFLYGEKSLRNATCICDGTYFLEWALNIAARQQNLRSGRTIDLLNGHFDGEAYSWPVFLEGAGISLERSKVVFIGTHSAAFDMSPVVAAAQYFVKDNQVDFVICGAGPMMAMKAGIRFISNVIFQMGRQCTNKSLA